ncbi:hypothetical protein [Nocardioides sp. TF02-7]|uniref:hypothetical protein n=1 Tax=Nocardioides sp. TF02-7 TaxID=2917724 RepID=UPI001F05E8DC|nr:hypothetical protein [Nocardioides sp. TF02-7]UMG94043.1 hypothetical protein MF408_08280 [Nocardioides sp. TF02-7]
MSAARLDTMDDAQYRAAHGRLRRSEAGVLAILRHAAADDVYVVFRPTGPAPRTSRFRTRVARHPRPVLR